MLRSPLPQVLEHYGVCLQQLIEGAGGVGGAG
jgi:hypothetical protein